MKALMKHLLIQFRMDIRERGTLMTYYLIPLVFYLFIGAVFTSVNPLVKNTLAASMAVFAATMGAVLGTPVPVVKMRESGVLRAYRVSGIPGWAVPFIHGISAFLHLLIVSSIILITAPVFFCAGRPQDYTAFFLTLVMLLFSTIAIGMLIGAAARSQSMAVMLSQMVFLPTVVLSGIMFPASMLPEPLRMLGRLLVGTYAMEAFSGLAYGLATDFSAPWSILVGACIGILAAGLAMLRFRRMGKSP
ncbi:MAG TPA: ABC transporter permease [Thermoclostridium caenicola]|uniref:ABC transporter permease n=1 Tax=Thermoclostridium caenicola TaxID=659425 RepID=UPI002C82E028|nr:ABC transporter permease [Thermoclostridium caenicola]HOK42973.1 ABC transporter permease [Thermoclostridium caenicola]